MRSTAPHDVSESMKQEAVRVVAKFSTMPSIALKALTEAGNPGSQRPCFSETEAKKRGSSDVLGVLESFGVRSQAVRRAEGDELVDDTTILLVHFRE